MENNGYHNAPEQSGTNAQQTGAISTANNITTFPDDADTNLQDISVLLDGAPVLQGEQPVDAPPTTNGAIASRADFEEVEETRPFSQKVAPKTFAGSLLAALIILPLSVFFMGGGAKNKSKQTAVEVTPAGEAGSGYVSPEDYAAMQAELEQLRSQQAFTDQQVDAEAIDEMGKQKAETESSQTAKPSTAAATAAKPSTVTTVSRPTPVPSRVATPAPRPAPRAVAPRSSASIATAPVRQIIAQPSEPIDPFERRAQLQALGTYGAPPPTAQAAARLVSDEAANPFDNPYIQTIAIEAPRAQPAFYRATSDVVAPTRQVPLTEEALQYEQDVETVLSAAPTTTTEADAPEEDIAAVLEPDAEAAEEPSSEAETATPMAIMPGTSTEAELPYGFSWQEGTPLPEVLLMTTEDVMAGSLTVIPAGSQFLAQAQIDPNSGTVTIQVVGLFGELQDIQIPRSSIVVQAEDGSMLTAKASGDSRNSSGADVSNFLMEALGNSVSNVIDSDDSLVGDVAGGVAETVIDGQIQRSQANAAARNSRRAAQPIVWTLDARPVQLTFNNYIPLYSEQR